MGGNTSKEDVADTVVAYTLYGFGCTRCCNRPTFQPGAPQNDCCGTSCTRIDFVIPDEFSQTISEYESHLDEAADIAMESIRWCSHVCCSQMDTTAKRAADALNLRWCVAQNEQCLAQAGLQCRASNEVYGFGRTRVTYLVLRVTRSKSI